jgi:nucleoside-diphosphate-sugar epimerase
MRYAVTGAAGFIGSHLAEELLARGHGVLGIDCFTGYYDPSVKEENARRLDVQRNDLAQDRLPLSGFDGIFHLAAQPGVRSFGERFAEHLRQNVLAAQRVFEAAAREGVRVVFASSSSVYGAAARYPTPEDTVPAPLSPYGVSKLAAEQLAAVYERSFGLDVVILRYFNAFGPRQRPDMALSRIASALIEGREFDLYGDGRQTRSWTFVSDVVEATTAAMERGSGTYNIGGTDEISVREAIGLFEQCSGSRLQIRQHPAVPGDQRRTMADTSRARADLGWAPRTAFSEGLRAQWEWSIARATPHQRDGTGARRRIA